MTDITLNTSIDSLVKAFLAKNTDIKHHIDANNPDGLTVYLAANPSAIAQIVAELAFKQHLRGNKYSKGTAMSFKTLLLAPAKPGNPVIVANGRSYAAIPPGTLTTVEGSDADVLTANGFVRVGYTGTTAQRPPLAMNGYRATVGLLYWDTTISAPVIFDGVNWRSPSTGSVA